jgi:branched-chain amino acid transport system permease protein
VLLQQVVNGLTLGAVYTLIALSFSLVMGIFGVLNLAIAELFMIGGYIGFSAIAAQLPLPVAVVLGMSGGAILAILIEKIAYEPLRESSLITPMLSTLGCSLILQNLATNVWGSDPLQLPDELLGGQLHLGAVTIGSMQVIVLVASVLLVAVLGFMIQRTRMGRAVRAVAENPDMAQLLGISAGRVTLLVFILSGALAGAAGVLIGLHYAAITPYVGVETGLKAIAVMVVGGVTRIWGALAAGPLVGMLEVLTVAYGGSQVRDLVVYGFMILILLIRPQGLLGERQADLGRV